MTSCTPGSPSSRDASTRPSLPTRPTAVRWAPGRGLASYPMSRITATTRSISCCVAPWRITISTSLSSDREPVAVFGDRDRAREPRARALRGVRSLYLRIEVGQDEAGRARLPGESAGALRGEVNVDRVGLGERAFREQEIAPRGPLAELVARPRVPGVDEPSLGRRHAHRHALGCMRHVTGLEAHVRAERERLPVAHGEDEHRQLAEVIGMKVGQHHVGDLLPGEAELRQPMQGSGAAVEQDAQLTVPHPMAGRDAPRRRSDGPSADSHELHALAPYAGSSWPRRTPTMVETPGSCIVTPYTASAACIVRGLCVITMNWVWSLNSA